MARKRTRKDKERANHQHLISWNPDSTDNKASIKNLHNAPSVKGQSNSSKSGTKLSGANSKYASFLDKNDGLASIRRDLVKSLIIASLILCLELVIYLNQ